MDLVGLIPLLAPLVEKVEAECRKAHEKDARTQALADAVHLVRETRERWVALAARAHEASPERLTNAQRQAHAVLQVCDNLLHALDAIYTGESKAEVRVEIVDPEGPDPGACTQCDTGYHHGRCLGGPCACWCRSAPEPPKGRR